MEEILKRRSVRDFLDKEVENEKIEQLLRAAMAAPTAANQREWEFIVVTDKTLIEKLSVSTPYSKPVAKAPLAIVMLGNFKKTIFPDCWQQDLGACAENILLDAVHLGLGGVWLAVAPSEDRMQAITDIFSLPEEVKPFSIIALGYPREDAATRDRYEQDKVHYNSY